ncbi:MAG: TonB family protein [Gammaproteobacteria bacterium]|jgi:colicin import membrane protein|nr:hypothetical protein [Gammaproteobacteria bacterium]MDP6095279.1 TonB family protein [Gammaproteobacteria bacterium]MDP7454953.1 TonB family protein [Gammaproteobacteria bacterium]HJO12674.1 TonB family protein [Gammaproteobacteria bacterium]|tara:strand:- start:5261 stop:6100 length:840 start_codon:yes stop_codon:yes gene_type:complete
MSNTFNNMVIYNGYPLSIVIAITFHSLVLAALLYLQTNNRIEALDLIQPTVIKALLIDENPQVRNEQILERQRLERIEDQRRQREEQARREQQQQEEQQRAEAERQRQERERSALLERQELERLQAEQLRREQEDRETEDQRQRELAAEQERQRQAAERDRQEQQVVAEAAAAEVARTEFELVQSATGLIQQVVQENWSRPPSARNGMRVLIKMSMLPTGEVIDVSITETSGDAAFDRAAETAVYRAAPFIELSVLPINIFNDNFRSLTLIFQPEDLLN